MDDVVIVDCSTGKATRREMTAEENTQRLADNAAYQKQQQAQQAADAAREATLAQVAQKVGISVDDLRSAFRVSPHTDQQTPQPKKVDHP